MATKSPLVVQELLNRCIDFLALSRYYTRDFVSCSLVARSWVDASQANLFRAPSFLDLDDDTVNAIPAFYRALTTNPALARYVRELTLPPSLPHDLSKINFTRLERLSITVKYSVSDGLGRLLSLPTLRYVSITTTTVPFSHFINAWSLCSPTIQHLELWCQKGVGDAPLSEVDTGRTVLIPLKSFSLDYTCDLDFDLTLPQSVFFPFDFSTVKALAVVVHEEIPWSLIPRSEVESLVIYSPVSADAAPDLDLSSFPKLTNLRIDCHDFILSNILEILSTISASQRVHTISLVFGEDLDSYPELCDALDTVLSSLPTTPLPCVELEVDDCTEELKDSFTKLISKNMLRVVPYFENEDEAEGDLWWRRIIDRL
ncbi:hypothetical protein R3P38DRAFT_2986025 [Favolaschia claudopus]|uniref:F-box domain-containing protein n=1 Tax=Favolaschia claudopus TaxID=2862362 RepID=A0AAW0AWR3_9AGAR